MQGGSQLGGLVGHQGRHRGRRDLVGGQAAGQGGDFSALAIACAPGKAGHDRAVAFLGNHHRVATVQCQVVIRRRVALEVVGDGVAGGLFGGVDQQLEVACQRQLLFLDDFHGVHRHDDTVLVVFGAATVHAIANQGDLERVETGAVLEYPVLRRHRHHVGVGVNTDHFIALAFQGNFIDTVVDVAKVQVEGLGQALDLLGDLDEFGVVVLIDAVDAEGRNSHQFTQGLGGRIAVLQPGIDPQQAMDFVLLFSRQLLVGQEGGDALVELVGLAEFAFRHTGQELAEILDRSVAEALENGRALLWGDVGIGRRGDRCQASEHQGGRSQFFQGEVHCGGHSFAGK
ncbi:hypothetical protein D3C80_1218390 [compost metagenome]